MKHFFSLILIVCFGLSASAQAFDTIPPYKKDPKMPAFSILQADSSWFSSEKVPASYPYVAIVYFSPTCGHCQIAAKDLAEHMDSLKNVFFVFVSYNQMNEIFEFADHYGLSKRPNVRFGRDPRYAIPSFFRVQATPFAAVYNKKRMLVRAYDPVRGAAIESANLLPVTRKK